VPGTESRRLAGVDRADDDLGDASALRFHHRQQIVRIPVAGPQTIEAQTIDHGSGDGRVATLAVGQRRLADRPAGQRAEHRGTQPTRTGHLVNRLVQKAISFCIIGASINERHHEGRQIGRIHLPVAGHHHDDVGPSPSRLTVPLRDGRTHPAVPRQPCHDQAFCAARRRRRREAIALGTAIVAAVIDHDDVIDPGGHRGHRGHEAMTGAKRRQHHGKASGLDHQRAVSSKGTASKASVRPPSRASTPSAPRRRAFTAGCRVRSSALWRTRTRRDRRDSRCSSRFWRSFSPLDTHNTRRARERRGRRWWAARDRDRDRDRRCRAQRRGRRRGRHRSDARRQEG
jgi:hypothetical protein